MTYCRVERGLHFCLLLQELVIDDSMISSPQAISADTPDDDVGEINMEESEEHRHINTADSVVVDSALSWFVEDKQSSMDKDELAS